MKNFDRWGKIKQNIEKVKDSKFFKEREVWWCFLGLNIGHEEDGKGKSFIRPVLVIKKHNKYCFLGVSLSSKIKKNNYYFYFRAKNKKYSAILSQIRLISSKRLITKIDKVDSEIFFKTKEKITQLNFE